jgi:hypothetical protein
VNMSINFKVKMNEAAYDLSSTDPLSQSIFDMKTVAFTLSNVPQDCQKWIFQGKVLLDDMLVSESGITEGNSVIVMKVVSTLPPPLPPLKQTPVFDNAMTMLLGNEVEIVQNAISVLIKVASNIVNNPMEQKYRQVPSKNATFHKKVGSPAGGNECMKGLGFMLESDNWVLTPTADAWENLIACREKLERFAKKLALMPPSNHGSEEQPITKISAQSTEIGAAAIATPQLEGQCEEESIQKESSSTPAPESSDVATFQTFLAALATMKVDQISTSRNTEDTSNLKDANNKDSDSSADQS